MLFAKRFILITLIVLVLMLMGYQCYQIVSPTLVVDNETKYAQLVDQYQLLKMQRLVLEEQRALASAKQNLSYQPELQSSSKIAISNIKQTQPVSLSIAEAKTFESLEAYVNDAKPPRAAALTNDEKKLLESSADDYTLQLMGVRDERELKRFIQENNLAGAYVFHTLYLNKDWYVLVYGHYRSRAEALKAIESISSPLQQLKPWARQLVSIQKAIQLYR